MSAEKLRDLLSTLFEYSCQPDFQEQMDMARELYAIATGKVNDDDHFYEARMGCFQEFFVFDYRLSDVFSGSTVFETFLLNAQKNLSVDALHDFEQLRSFRKSLFIGRKEKGDTLEVRDLLAGRHYVAHALPDFTFTGFDADQIFEGRVIGFEGMCYLTGAFIFHPKEVTSLIEKYIKSFLKGRLDLQQRFFVDWRAELKRRHELLASVAENRRMAEQAEKKRAIDVLNVTKNFVNLSRIVSSPHLIMSLGFREDVSPFVPETPFYESNVLLQRLAYCEIKSYRYKHLDPVKIYTFEGDEAPRSSVPIRNVGSAAEAAVQELHAK
jgi:hypothetical protein